MINKQINNICKYTKMNYLLICSLALLTDKFVKCFLHFFHTYLCWNYCHQVIVIYLSIYLFLYSKTHSLLIHKPHVMRSD